MCSNKNKMKVREKPKCVKCRNHGIIIFVQGHKKDCKFKECTCKKCILPDERRRIEAQIKLVSRNEKQKRNKYISSRRNKKTYSNFLQNTGSFIASYSQEFLENNPSTNLQEYMREVQTSHCTGRQESDPNENNAENMEQTDDRPNGCLKHSIDNILKREDQKGMETDRQGCHEKRCPQISIMDIFGISQQIYTTNMANNEQSLYYRSAYAISPPEILNPKLNSQKSYANSHYRHNQYCLGLAY